MNRQVALFVWDPRDDNGFQLLGSVAQIEERAMLNGFVPQIEMATPMLQVERKLHVRVDKVIRFSHAPHSDI